MPQRFGKELATLFQGYNKFREKYLTDYSKMFKKLATEGQKPKTMLISCSDSRVDPTIIMGCSPGEIFVFRNVANLVPSYFDSNKNTNIGAALEFAVCHLQVQNIIVMGHSGCGGIKALLENEEEKSENTSSTLEKAFIKDWVQIAKTVKEKIVAEHKHLPADAQAKLAEEQAMLLSLDNLRTYPWLKDNTKVTLHAWRFDMMDGLIQCYNPESKTFEELRSQVFENQASSSAEPPPLHIPSKL